jgi:hypothetical protein
LSLPLMQTNQAMAQMMARPATPPTTPEVVHKAPLHA